MLICLSICLQLPFIDAIQSQTNERIEQLQDS